jgi:SAM-dependent methyltransferase
VGLNAAEMAANPQLTRWLVHDLNADPTLPEAEASFDLALCTVSVQYLTRPLEVFAAVRRALRPGAPFLVTFSNRCFPTKAVEIWNRLDDRGHMQLVESYLREAGNFRDIHSLDRSPRRLFSDPLYAAVARSTGPFAGNERF